MASRYEDEFAPPQIKAVYRLVKDVQSKPKILYIGHNEPKDEHLLSPFMSSATLRYSEYLPDTPKRYDLIVLDANHLTAMDAARAVSKLKRKGQKVLAIGYSHEQIKQLDLTAANKVVDGRNRTHMDNLPTTIEELVLPTKSRT